LNSVEELAAVIDDIAVLYDLRQGGFSGDLPFASDSTKAAFHLALMARPSLLHASVLRLGGDLLAAQLGLAGRRCLHFGVLAYSPLYGEHSPGVMHVRLLGQLAAKEGFESIDLTPGGTWKDRFATTHDSVSRLTVFAARSHAVRADVTRQAATLARKALRSVRLEPAAINELVSRARRRPFRAVGSILRRGKARLFHAAELRGYSLPASEVRHDQSTALASRDRLSDLLTFQEFQGSPSRTDFFKMAVSRLEAGHHVYTRVDKGRLVHWGWLAENPKTGFMDEVHQEYIYPPGSAVVYDFFTHPEARGRGLYSSSIRQMMADAAAAGMNQIFVFVLADNDPSRRVIEKAGFRHVVSLFEQIQAGKAKRWRTDASP
jgi:RimJ/RimL family protein N-acetyltransferase